MAGNHVVTRLAVRTDGQLVLGGNADLLKPGHVYEITKIQGVLVVKDMGESCLTVAERLRHPQYLSEDLRDGDVSPEHADPEHTWAFSVETLLATGRCLLTGPELAYFRRKGGPS